MAGFPLSGCEEEREKEMMLVEASGIVHLRYHANDYLQFG